MFCIASVTFPAAQANSFNAWIKPAAWRAVVYVEADTTTGRRLRYNLD